MAGEKLERLLNLTALLLETPRPLPARHIHERLGGYYPEDRDAFRRAFERDKDDLRSMGVPLEVERVPGVDPPVDGYRIPKDRYYLRDPGLDGGELAALRLAASLVQLEGLPAREGLLKLGGLVEGDPAGHLAGGLAVNSLPAGDVAPLFGAIAARQAVRFAYRGERRTLEPHRLDFARGRWYVSGRDRDRGELRVFRLDRFEGPAEVLTGDRFERPPTAVGVRLDPWALGEGPPVEARVLVDASQAPWIVQHLGPGAVSEERDDGSVVVTMAVTNRDNFRSFVLTFLEHAEVLDPPELRQQVVTWLRRQAA
ncbi:MAG TPA: WYL domain-containing protein [Acidimicrobiales bacterium]|nr:WYL domain-containing protein [Acidimicrobiales bacterium]